MPSRADYTGNIERPRDVDGSQLAVGLVAANEGNLQAAVDLDVGASRPLRTVVSTTTAAPAMASSTGAPYSRTLATFALPAWSRGASGPAAATGSRTTSSRSISGTTSSAPSSAAYRSWATITARGSNT